MILDFKRNICIICAIVAYALYSQEPSAKDTLIKQIIESYEKSESNEKIILEFVNLYRQIDQLANQTIEEDNALDDKLSSFNAKYFSLLLLLRFAVIDKIDEVLESFDPTEVIF